MSGAFRSAASSSGSFAATRPRPPSASRPSSQQRLGGSSGGQSRSSVISSSYARRDAGRDVEGDLLAAHLRSALHLSQEEKEVRGRARERRPLARGGSACPIANATQRCAASMAGARRFLSAVRAASDSPLTSVAASFAVAVCCCALQRTVESLAAEQNVRQTAQEAEGGASAGLTQLACSHARSPYPHRCHSRCLPLRVRLCSLLALWFAHRATC